MVDLALDVVEQADVLNLSFEYDSCLFKKETIQRFTEYFINLLKEVVKNPEIRLSDIEIISPTEIGFTITTGVNYGLRKTKQERNIRYWTFHEDDEHYAIVLISANVLEKLGL